MLYADSQLHGVRGLHCSGANYTCYHFYINLKGEVKFNIIYIEKLLLSQKALIDVE